MDGMWWEFMHRTFIGPEGKHRGGNQTKLGGQLNGSWYSTSEIQILDRNSKQMPEIKTFQSSWGFKAVKVKNWVSKVVSLLDNVTYCSRFCDINGILCGCCKQADANTLEILWWYLWNEKFHYENSLKITTVTFTCLCALCVVYILRISLKSMTSRSII